MSKIVGKVSEVERDEIQRLFERKNGLIELAKVITPDYDLYEKLVSDLGRTSSLFQKWWDDMSIKYNWESSNNGKWSIIFETCEITLDD